MRSIGDTVFIAWASSHHDEEVQCPVCFGRCEVHVILGDDSIFAVKCGECHKGLGTRPTGRTTRYCARVGVTRAEVTGVEKDGDDYRYRYSPPTHEELGAFDTEEEAQTVADEAYPRMKEHADKIAARIPSDKWESASWSVHYHRSAIRDAKKQIEWHQSQLREVK